MHAYPTGPHSEYRRMAGEPLHAERESLETLAQIKRSMGSFMFAAQYQQSPIPPEGELMKWAWFRFYHEPPTRGGGLVVQSWDTASKGGDFNDFSVCTSWLVKDREYYLLDVFRRKLLFPDLKRAVVALAQRFRPDKILIEDKGSGTQLIQELKHDRPPEVV